MSSSPKPEMVYTPEEIIKKCKAILKANGISDPVSEVLVTSPETQEGMVSLSHNVTVKFEDPDLKPLYLFGKTHTGNPSHTEMIEGMKAFEKEATFYKDYLPAAKEFCKRKGQDDLLDIFAKCYYADEQFFLFENLVIGKGYVLLKKEEMQGLEEAKAALRTLAIHHAVSYAFILELGGPKKFFEKFLHLDYEAQLHPFMMSILSPTLESGVKSSVSILEQNKVEGWEMALAKMKSYGAEANNEVFDTLKYNHDGAKLVVLNHGDYWNHNMLFLQDKETRKIIGHKAVDLQLTRYASPSLDIAYYLFTTVKPDIRRAHFRYLLDHYLETLKEVAGKLGCELDLTSEDLHLDFRKNFKSGFWFGCCILGGPGREVITDIDMSTLTDLNNFSKEFDKLIENWMAKYPEKGAKLAEEIVESIREYDGLALPKIT